MPTEGSNDRVEHLKMIQEIISRMAHTSFILKGWTITLVSALFALAATQSSRALLLLALLPTVGFWLLDGYYLRQERLFRGLYDEVRLQSGPVDFSMEVGIREVTKTRPLSVLASVTLLAFYGVTGLIVVLVFFGADFS